MAARLTTFVVVAIVAVTLIAGLIVGAQRDDSDGPVDLIVHNARVYTATAEGVMAEAVAIRGNQILRVGSDREISRLKRPQTLMIDAKGGAVLPGFNDTQVELVNGGAALDRVDLLEATTLEELERVVMDWADANPDRPWVLGRGWRHELFADGAPTRQLLDRLVPDRPARLLSTDGLTAWVNSPALRLAKIGRGTSQPQDGISRDARTGEPAGVLEGEAAARLDRLVPALTAGERERALRAAIAEAHRYGVTSVHDTTAGLAELAAYAEARRTGDLPIRVYAAVPVTGDPSDGELDRLQVGLAKFPDDPLFKAGALRVSLDDGPSGARPAADTLRFDVDAFNRLIRRLDARGWQIVTDAATGQAVHVALGAYEHAVRSNPGRIGDRRHRIRNLGVVADEDLPRFATLGLLASLRPAGWRTTDDMDNLAMARGLAAAPARLVLGSGWPAASFDPIRGLAALISPSGPAPAIGSGISLKSAIDAYTSGAAWASFDEQRKGTLATGMLADIVVLSTDIFGAPSALAAARVEVTIFDGKVVYRRAEHATN